MGNSRRGAGRCLFRFGSALGVRKPGRGGADLAAFVVGRPEAVTGAEVDSDIVWVALVGGVVWDAA
jgi:hypothetical protein